MSELSLGQAARLTGLSKATLSRAIHSGKLSATRREGGGYSIDPSELARVFNVTHETGPGVGETGFMMQSATGPLEPVSTSETPLATRLAAAEAEIAGLRELLAEVRASRDDWKSQAEDWKSQTERLTLALPAPQPAPPEPKPADALAAARARPWWRRIAG